MAPDDFLNRAGVRTPSISEIQRLADTMEILAVVVDSRVLKIFELKDLLAG